MLEKKNCSMISSRMSNEIQDTCFPSVHRREYNIHVNSEIDIAWETSLETVDRKINTLQ